MCITLPAFSCLIATGSTCGPSPPVAPPVTHCLPDGVLSKLILSFSLTGLLLTLLDEAHAPVILSAINDLVKDWEYVAALLGLEDSVIQEIKHNSMHQVSVCCKDMIIRWLQQGKATRQDLISALETLSE